MCRRQQLRGQRHFYAMFRHKPIGRHLIQLCINVACMIMGAERLVDILKSRYNLEPNGTTDDGRFSLVIMECIIPNNFDGKGVFAVMNWRMNPVIKSPAMDFTEAVVKRVKSATKEVLF